MTDKRVLWNLDMRYYELAGLFACRLTLDEYNQWAEYYLQSSECLNMLRERVALDQLRHSTYDERRETADMLAAELAVFRFAKDWYEKLRAKEQPPND